MVWFCGENRRRFLTGTSVRNTLEGCCRVCDVRNFIHALSLENRLLLDTGDDRKIFNIQGLAGFWVGLDNTIETISIESFQEHFQIHSWSQC